MAIVTRVGNSRNNDIESDYDADGVFTDYIFYGYGGNDTLSTGGNEDTLYGGNGNDSLFGGQSQDALFGEDGNDVLYGSSGSDNIYDYGGLPQAQPWWVHFLMFTVVQGKTNSLFRQIQVRPTSTW
jgi:Ca2+-binding RTX toxin-like protein